MRGLRAFLVVGFVGLAGCSGISPDSPRIASQLDRFPGVEQQIRTYYRENALELDDLCGMLNMGPITKVQVMSETATQLRLGITYFFSNGGMGPGDDICLSGVGSRVVTFKRAGNAWALEGMSGELR